MVQLRPPESFEYEREKDYWKLIRPKGLTNKKLGHDIRAMSGFRCSTLPREHLCRLFIRVQRGLPVYEKYRLSELVKFVHDRRVRVRSYQPAQLIKRLIDADEHFVFERFQDLPPEIRLEIYEIHMATLKCKSSFAPPPITLVSKVTRHESLPVFASLFMNKKRRFVCRFKFSDTPSRAFPDDITTVSMSEDTQAFWSRAPEAFIEHVQQLQIFCAVIGFWHIDLSAKARGSRLTFELARIVVGHAVELKVREVARHITNALQKLIEDIDARQNSVFRRKDAQHIFDAFGTALDMVRQDVASQDV